MKPLTLLPGLMILGWIVFQSCFFDTAPEGMVFSTQGQIDSFLLVHRDCTVIQNGVTISGEDITNLDGLNGVTAINGFLSINQNTLLTSLEGLSSLTSVSQYFDIWGNSRLRNLQGLNKLHHIGKTLFLTMNDSLTSLEGLDSLKVLDGLHVNLNNSLVSFKGMESLTQITTNLMIGNNPLLRSFDGLQNLEGIGGSLLIKDNEKLSECAVRAVCARLEVPDRGINISGNGGGCNTIEEIKAGCGGK